MKPAAEYDDLIKALPEITHNVRIKFYPNGTQEVWCASEAIFRESGWEAADKWKKQDRKGSASSDGSANIERAQRRARMAIRDLALSNEFKYFVTLTLDASKVDRYDIAAMTKRMNTWLDNCVRRKGLKYILVPELHKDGAIHYHGFFNAALPVTDSGTLSVQGRKQPTKPRSKKQRQLLLSEGASVVYNIDAWSFGFSTAIELYGEYRKAVAYVCKYIGKDSRKIGGRWYYSGGDLKKPSIAFSDVDIEQFMCENEMDEPTFTRAGVDFAVCNLGD